MKTPEIQLLRNANNTGINFIEDIVNRFLLPSHTKSEIGRVRRETLMRKWQEEYTHITYPHDYIEEEKTYDLKINLK